MLVIRDKIQEEVTEKQIYQKLGYEAIRVKFVFHVSLAAKEEGAACDSSAIPG